MTKYLIIILSLLFVTPTYGSNNTTVLKKRNHTIKHSSFLRHDRVHAVYAKHTKPDLKQKLHVATVGGAKHVEVKGSGLLARTLTNDQIVAIMDHYNVPERDQGPILTSIDKASAKHHVSKTLIVAIIARESSFKKHAVSSAGAQGIMQVMPSHHIPSPFSIPTNIDHGTAILASYIDDAGNLEGGLASYGNSRKYVREVYATLRALDRLV